MEYVLRNTDIFDPKLDEKFATIILNEQFDTKKVYKIIVSFHDDLLKELSRFDGFILPVPNQIINKRKKSSEKDKIYDVLGFQLKQLEVILEKNNIDYYSSTIQGDQLESVHIIKIEIDEDTEEPTVISNGKKNLRGKLRSVIPSKPYTQNLVSELASERLNELYSKIFNIIKNKKIMSEILEIDETDNDSLLFQEFVKEYGDLWLTTSEKEKQLLDKLRNKSIEVLEKYIES